MKKIRALILSIVVVLSLATIWLFLTRGQWVAKLPKKPTTEKVASQPVIVKKPTSTSHLVRKNESLWRISKFEYRVAHYWPIIYINNKPLVKNPDLIYPGNSLKIPIIKDVHNLDELERQQLALGNLFTYFCYKKQGRTDALAYLWVARYWDSEVVEKHRTDIPKKDLSSLGRIDKKRKLK